MNPNRRRAPIKRRLRELAAYAMPFVDLSDLATVDEQSTALKPIVVSYTWDGKLVTTPTFFVGVTFPGESRPTGMNRKANRGNDLFSVQGHIEIPGFKMTDAGARDAEEAAERALNAFARTVETCGEGLVHDDVPSEMDNDTFRTTVCFVSDGEVYHGLPDPQAASFSGGVTFAIDCQYPFKPTPLSTGS